jgi:preprotein translocase subunit YajC
MRIDDLTLDQLLELNTFICQRIDELQDQENLQALSQLRVGLKVTFNGRSGPAVGIVTKINRKSVIVLAEDGKAQYKVSPGLLRPLRDVK